MNAMTVPLKTLGACASRYALKSAAPAALLAGLMMSAPATAGESCNCVANGQRVELGQLFCIRTASGNEFLARCERVLNNTSWKRVGDSCPSAQLMSTPQSEPLL